MTNQLKALQEAEKKAAALFAEVQNQNVLRAGMTEKQINTKIFELAKELFGIEKYWHKRIVRAGRNTLLPYDENPPNLHLQEDDILFLDFGPIFEDWEADYGRTYVLGEDPIKLKIAADSERLWHLAHQQLMANPSMSGADLYAYCVDLAEKSGWHYGGPIAGHLIGMFPHEKLDEEDKTNYIHPENHRAMNALNQNGEKRFWIIEIHLVDRARQIGAFFEQLATY